MSVDLKSQYPDNDEILDATFWSISILSVAAAFLSLIILKSIDKQQAGLDRVSAREIVSVERSL